MDILEFNLYYRINHLFFLLHFDLFREIHYIILIRYHYQLVLKSNTRKLYARTSVLQAINSYNKGVYNNIE
jgi:hypothetical protein